MWTQSKTLETLALIGCIVFVVDFGGQCEAAVIFCHVCEFTLEDCKLEQAPLNAKACSVGVAVCKTTATGRACGAVGETTTIAGECKTATGITPGTTCCVGAAGPCNVAKKGAEGTPRTVTDTVTDKVHHKVKEQVPDKVAVNVKVIAPGKVVGIATNETPNSKTVTAEPFKCYNCQVNLVAGTDKRCNKTTPDDKLVKCEEKIKTCRLTEDTWGCGDEDAGTCKEPDCCNISKCNIAHFGSPKGGVYSHGKSETGSTSEAATAGFKLALILLTSFLFLCIN